MARRPLKAWALHIAKWAAMVACLMLLAAWAAAWRWDLSRDDTRTGRCLSVLRVRDACLVVTWITDPGWSWPYNELEWWARRRDPGSRLIAAPPPPPTGPGGMVVQGGGRRYTTYAPGSFVIESDGDTPDDLDSLLLESQAPPATAPPPAPQVIRIPGPMKWWDPRTLDWRPRLHRIKPMPVMTCKVPLWLLFTLAACITGLLWWLQPRFHGGGCCRVCGYDLSGLSGSVCPECGRAMKR